jgi:hypothetical protein
MTLFRIAVGVVAAALALWMTASVATAFDETKYPDWSGQWKRAPGVNPNSWDETKRPGRPQQPPLTPEYQTLWEASMADQAAGGQGRDTRVTCVSNGMPRLMTVLRTMGIVIMPDITYVMFENNVPRWIYTDGRQFSDDEEPTYAGYSVGKWLDTDGDGRFDTLEVETRYFLSADGFLMPTKKDQAPPDLRYFKQTRK